MNYPIRGQAVKGFTLIEFLVASILAMIVIMAAGSTYFMTRKLSDEAQKRLNIQQNLRTTTAQIMRDARMAGSFGCYNTSSTIENRGVPVFNVSGFTLIAPEGSGTEGGVLKLEDVDNAMGVRWAQVGGQNALIFVYGLGDTPVVKATGLTTASTNNLTGLTLGTGTNNEKALDPLRQTLANRGNIVVSSCRSAYGVRMTGAVTSDNLAVNIPNSTFTQTDTGELSVSKLYAAAYIHNATTKQLMRVDVGDDGKWQAPQLVAEGINSMDVSYAYTDDCLLDKLSTDTDYVAETFTFTKNLNTTKDKGILPAMVQIRLNYDLDTSGANKATADYVINATVRGGNVCGNRTPVPN